MKLTIINYGAGNTQSVKYALERLGVTPILSDNAEEIAASDYVLFPGVGHAAAAMKRLTEKGLDQLIPTLQQPVLGICLGMQLLCKNSAEGDTRGLGIFEEEVLKFESEKEKVPHMGWNTIKAKNDSFITAQTNQFMYFVHSYYVPLGPNTAAQTDYIQPFSAALQKDNFYGVQFHPEKSATEGATILKQFIEL